jgi:tetratricopeptide (TPR) repeat protein
MSSGSGRLPPSFGDYGVVRLIASGGMGAVFEVKHRATGVRYALKTILRPGDEQARARFRREAELIARCDRHPGIVKAHSLGETPEGQLYIVLDLVSGESLDALLERERRLPASRVAALGRVLAEALAHVHAQGIVHRDVKPSNILIDESGPRLTDFGLSTAEDVERLTRTGQFLGTAFYVAPEQAAHRPVGPAADVFSLGAVLYHALSGEVPLRADTYIAFFANLTSDDPVEDVRTVFPEAPPALAAILARALEKDPARRYASALEMARDLERFEHGGPTHAAADAERVRRRRRVQLLASIAAVGVSCALATIPLARLRATRARLAAAESELALAEAASKRAPAGAPGLEARLATVAHAANALAAIGSGDPVAGGDALRERALGLVSDASTTTAAFELEGGEPVRAVATLRAGAALGPLSARARLILARALLASHDARAAADEAAALAPSLPETARVEAFEVEGDAALEAGDRARALAAFSRALTVRPGVVEVQAKRGGLAALAGDAATAASDLAALIPDASKLAREREHNARLAPLAPALYARFLAGKHDVRDLEAAWHLAPPPEAQRLEVVRAALGWQAADALEVTATLGSAVGGGRLGDPVLARIARNLRASTIAQTLWPAAPLPWEMLAVVRALVRDLEPDRLESACNDMIRDAPRVPTLPYLVATARRHRGDLEGELRALLDAIASFPEDVIPETMESRFLAGEILDLPRLHRPFTPAELDPFLRFARRHESVNALGLIQRYEEIDLLPRALEALDLGWTAVEHAVEKSDARAAPEQQDLHAVLLERLHVLRAKLPADPGPVLAIASRAAGSRAVASGEVFVSIASSLGWYGCVKEAKALASGVASRDPEAGHLAAGEVLVGRVEGLLAARKLDAARALVAEPDPDAGEEQRLAAAAAVLDADHSWVEEAALLEGHASSTRLLVSLASAYASLGDEARVREIARTLRSRFDYTSPFLARLDAGRTVDETERKSGPREALAIAATLAGKIHGPAPELKGFAARAHVALGEEAEAASLFEAIVDTEWRPQLERFFPLAPKKAGFLRPRVLAGPEATFHLYGRAGEPFTIADVKGPVAVEPASGTFPAVLTVRATGDPGSLAGFSFRAVPASGEPAVATGTLFRGTWKGTIVPCPPADRDGAWRTAQGDAFEATDLAFPWRQTPPSAHVSFTDFALSAECVLSVAAGTCSIETLSDDGIRVFVDGALSLDFWVSHEATRKNVSVALATGKHRVRVEYYEGGPPAYLRVRFGAAPPP